MIQLKFCVIEWTPEGCITRFPDGAEIGAHPHPGLPHYSVISHQVGTGDDLLLYCRSHEVAHNFVEERLHDRPSRVLWALAHDDVLSGKDAAYEEIAAQTFQAWVYANRRPIIGGINWDALKRDFIALVESHDA